MKVQLDKAYPMPASPETVWQFLQRIDAVAECMPGAQITERLGDHRYKGTVTVRVGPATLAFRGELEASGIDPARRSLHLVGKGTDATGTSAATMDLVARVEAAEGGSSRLLGTSEVTMSGKAAAFGGRMAGAVADQILERFAANFAARVATMPSPAPSASVAPASEVRPMNGLAIAWAALRAWIRSRFSRK